MVGLQEEVLQPLLHPVRPALHMAQAAAGWATGGAGSAWFRPSRDLLVRFGGGGGGTTTRVG